MSNKPPSHLVVSCCFYSPACDAALMGLILPALGLLQAVDIVVS